jgi:hypothetical protein
MISLKALNHPSQATPQISISESENWLYDSAKWLCASRKCECVVDHLHPALPEAPDLVVVLILCATASRCLTTTMMTMTISLILQPTLAPQ